MLFFNKLVEIFNEVLHLSAEDGLELCVDFRMEVIKSIDEASQIALQWPAVSALGQEVYQSIEGISLDELADINLVTGVDQRCQDLEESADVGESRAHYYRLRSEILLLIFLDELVNVGISHVSHDVGIRVVLHDLQDLYLMGLERPPITVDEVPEEIQQFGLVVTIIGLVLDVLADFSNELEDCTFVIEHGLVIIVHFFQEIDAADVPLDVMDHAWDVPLHKGFNLVEVFNQRDDEVVRKMEQFYGQFTLRELCASEDEVQDL